MGSGLMDFFREGAQKKLETERNQLNSQLSLYQNKIFTNIGVNANLVQSRSYLHQLRRFIGQNSNKIAM